MKRLFILFLTVMCLLGCETTVDPDYVPWEDTSTHFTPGKTISDLTLLINPFDPTPPHLNEGEAINLNLFKVTITEGSADGKTLSMQSVNLNENRMETFKLKLEIGSSASDLRNAVGSSFRSTDKIVKVSGQDDTEYQGTSQTLAIEVEAQ